ncbi:MAG TPA: hypothetical protein VMJ30_06420, partial [Gemmatimonadales bacterium]|nr:hypothetical protein [Gemmatimonadales bacterium]
PGATRRLLVLDALYWEGDRPAAIDAVRELMRSSEGPRPSTPAAREQQDLDICVVAQWRVAMEGDRNVQRAVARLSAELAPGDSSVTVNHARKCIALLAVLGHEAPGAAEPDDRGQALDSLLLAGLPPYRGFAQAPLVLARLLEKNQNYPAALAMIRRQSEIAPPVFLSTYLLEEGRLASRAGDFADARRAYHHFLTLRAESEPSLSRDVRLATTELEAISRRVPP